ncbi:carboxymuconolactone decarboxylase family protein [Gulosibacter sp. ACHW.36C]|uniref:Carboxymuconolactone decarboxylase family protein n=1 Tax=Gulosibacter sediminis TaxID=1729695 RepID=A0ABY4MVY0_9MICO|nr:carboxymuconolactone decarboxylase family protein [Gulosibacter sediminis]UQN14582.1 carboxymuconolactone decarboxylase family protein [Gulosibacter sediminis]
MTTSDSLPDLSREHRAVYRGAVRMAQAAGDAAETAGIPRALVELINVRVSQINGCARCLSVHVPAARKAGVDDAKLHLASAWREAGVFSDLERAALEIAELTTELPIDPARAAFAAGRQGQLSDDQIAAIEWIAISIGAFNRISIMSGHHALADKFVAGTDAGEGS